MSNAPSEISGVVWFTAAVERECELGCGCAIEVGDRVAFVAADYAVACQACGERAEQEHSPGSAS